MPASVLSDTAGTPARIVFAGTPEFARVSLKSLVDAAIVPLAVLTQPDRRAGRGRTIKASPVKRYALEHGIPVWQPATLKDSDVVSGLAELEPDAIVVAAYGLIFPSRVLELPALGCINVHASLLPRWRGAAPVQAAILAGDADTGISLMQMEAGLDSGPVLVQEALAIGERETAGELQDRLAVLGGQLLLRHFAAILERRHPPVAQDERNITYANKIQKEDAGLDWRLPALQLMRKVRAYNPVPGASFEVDGERVKCWMAAVVDAAAPPGTIVAAGRGGIDVACGDGALRLLELQRPGRGKVSAFEFESQLSLSGRRLPV